MTRHIGELSRVLVTSFVFILGVTIAGEGVADAYIDPGGGSLLWQLAIGSFATAAYALHRLLNWTKNNRQRTPETPTTTESARAEGESRSN